MPLTRKKRPRTVAGNASLGPFLLLTSALLLPGKDIFCYRSIIPRKRNQLRRTEFDVFTRRQHRQELSNNSNNNNIKKELSHDTNYMMNRIVDMQQQQQPLIVLRRQRQRRKKPIDRKPRNYWYNATHLHSEMLQFWSNLGVKVSNPTSPTIPNEVLLIYYQRHDIRAAIVKNGGRTAVSTLLNNATILPGRWKDAIESNNHELQQLLQIDQNLSKDRPPWINTTTTTTSSVPTASKTIKVTRENNDNNTIELDAKQIKLWSHHDGRNQKGYWNLQAVIQELYEYVDQHKLQNNRPSIWMPRPSELAANGRDDLRQAINRYGGIKSICRTAGMIPYQEWYYFEGQYELLIDLKQYLDVYANSDYTVFPTVSDIRRNGYDQLYNLIQYYGGRKFLSARLNMSTSHKKHNKNGYYNKVDSNYNGNDRAAAASATTSTNGIKFGLFDLIFGIQFLSFVRMDQLQRSPPLRTPMIAMPSRTKLLSHETTIATPPNSTTSEIAIINGTWLDMKIDEYGGYENVARRLGLALFPTSL